jgi:RNA polymerase sigma factor (sigma-70 family)
MPIRGRRTATLEELERLYRTRRASFERVATGVAGDAELGADAVHDAFVLAVRHRGRFRGDAPLEAWLWRIVVNEARRRLATELQRRVGPPSAVAEESLASSNGRREHGTLEALVAALPERQRLVLFLRYYADLDYEAIAEALGVKPGTVAATLHAAHAALRRDLQEVER